MDADTAFTRVNEERLRRGLAPVVLTEKQRQQAFATLRQYVAVSGRPIEVAIQDVVRFQIQTDELESRRQL